MRYTNENYNNPENKSKQQQKINILFKVYKGRIYNDKNEEKIGPQIFRKMPNRLKILK